MTVDDMGITDCEKGIAGSIWVERLLGLRRLLKMKLLFYGVIGYLLGFAAVREGATMPAKHFVIGFICGIAFTVLLAVADVIVERFFEEIGRCPKR